MEDRRDTRELRTPPPGSGAAGEPSRGSLLDGRYRLDAVIARGGMSTVHLATDERLDRHVAVKLLDPALASDRSFVDRFTLEARSVARLSDPGIVQVFDQGVAAGRAYLVMEVVPGGTLRELLDERGPMPPYAAAAVLRPLLGALREAHAAGLVHRDIKPENVLVSGSGAVKLADFGLVRAVSESRATSRSVVMGTAAYLSPEQISAADTDGRSDLYSLGVLAFEMLTGRTPFPGDSSVAVAYRRLQEDVPAPSTAADGLAPDLDELVVRATAREPGARYAGAPEMLAELDRLAAELGFPAYTVPAPRESAWARARRDAAARTSPGDESEFEAADRESGEALRARPEQGPRPTRVQALAEPAGRPGLAPAPPVGPLAAGPHVPPERIAQRGFAPEPGHGDAGRAAVVPVAPRPPAVRPRRRLGLLWLAVVLLLALVVAVAGWWLGSGRLVPVPSVRGMSVAEATRALDDVGLRATTRTAFDDEVPASAVVATEPEQGAGITPGGTVTVVVSAGRPVVPEPGGDRSVDTVSTALRDRALNPVRGPTVSSETVPAGRVAALVPRPGTTVAVGTTVTMSISSGPAPVTVPDVSRLDAGRAAEALRAAGFVVGEPERVFDAAVPGGDAIGSSPAAGERAPRGSRVTLRVSSALQVPDVRGKGTEQAVEALRAAGLSPIVDRAVTDRDVHDGHVVRTEPAAGSRVDSGSPVVRVVPSDSVAVPMVLGMRVQAARDALTEAGLVVRVDTGRSGVVYGQTPLPGRVLARGAEVELDALG